VALSEGDGPVSAVCTMGLADYQVRELLMRTVG
jgi:hypothetical protein